MIEKFDPFACDIGVLRYINNLEGKAFKRLKALALVLLPVFLLIIVTVIEGNFFTNDYLSRIRAIPQAVFDSFFSATAADPTLSPDDATYPLLGDFFVGTVYLLQVLNICILHKQWRVMESFFVHLHGNGVVSFNAEILTDVNARIQGLNQSLFRIGKGPIQVLTRTVKGLCNHLRTHGKNRPEAATGRLEEGAPGRDGIDIRKWIPPTTYLLPFGTLATVVILLTILLASGINADSTFSNLTVENPAAAYSEWWASPLVSGSGLLFTFISICLVYYIALQNVVGFRVVWFFWVLFRKFRGHIELSADFRTPKRRFGWQPLRDLWNTITYSIGCNFLSLLVIFSVYRTWWLIPLFLLFLCSLLFLIVPLYLLGTPLRRFREREREAAAGQLAKQFPDDTKIGWRRAYRDEFALINNATLTVILGRRNAFVRWVTVVGTLLSFVAIL